MVCFFFQFDDGGPLLCDGYFAGFVARGDDCQRFPDKPGVYTQVAFHLDWIRATAGWLVNYE